MSDELTTQAQSPDLLADLGITQVADDSYLKEMGSSSFIPSMRLNTKMSADRPDVGHFYLYKNQKNISLPKTLDVIPLAWLPKATHTGEGISVFTPSHEKFIEIQEGASQKTTGTNPCMFGTSYLVYVPHLKECVEFFFGSPTLRNEVPSVQALLGKTATFGSKMIPNKTYGDYLSTSVEPATTPHMITSEEKVIIKEAVEKFQKFPESAIKRIEAKAESTVADDNVVER